jgi:SNW domain-containing protein 1
MEAMGNRKSKLTRDEDRDVSERVALGMQAASGTKETQYDQRLFNQSAGMTSGFGDDDAYNAYDAPMLKRGDASQHIYRPTANKDDEAVAAEADAEFAKLSKTDKFQPAKGFQGAEKVEGHVRDGPVQFEKVDEEDPYGLDSFLLGAKSANGAGDDRSARKRAFDDVGRRGHMGAAGCENCVCVCGAQSLIVLVCAM